MRTTPTLHKVICQLNCKVNSFSGITSKKSPFLLYSFLTADSVVRRLHPFSFCSGWYFLMLLFPYWSDRVYTLKLFFFIYGGVSGISCWIRKGVLEVIYAIIEALVMLACGICVSQQDFCLSGYLWFICWNVNGSIFSSCWSADIGWRITVIKTPIELTLIYVTDWKRKQRKIYFVNLFVLLHPASLIFWKYCLSLPVGAPTQNNAKFFEDPANFSLEYEARKARFPEYNPEAQIERGERPITEEEKKAREELAEKFRLAQEEFTKKALAEKEWDEDLLDLSMSFFMALTVVMYISYFRSEAMGRTQG